MGKIFYIADWHYDHSNCIAFDNRPFKNVEEMNSELIRRWNSVVSADDIVYSLGDMFWGKPADAIPVLEQLNGKKFLVKGNHDRVGNVTFDCSFSGISPYVEIQDEKRHVVLCHYPIPCYNRHHFGSYHLYGHVHSSFEHNMTEHDRYLMQQLYLKPCRMANVGAMMPYMDYTPRTLDEICAAMEGVWLR